ncbi:ABC transporter permease [Streptomyces sp. NPDC127118]|uniref:ABC transporter permease n=1 Tax=Streptomyces sp. NPDC127118 TaxID=3345369 RepID=UPI0036279804
MLRTALRNVLAHKARLVMTALSVMLGVAFVSGTLVFGDTVASAFRAASTVSLKNVAVSVQAEYVPGAGSETPTTVLDSRLVDRVRDLPGVTAARPSVNGSATLARKDGEPLNADSSWQNLAADYTIGTDGKDARHPLVSGRAPVAGGELALDTTTAEKAGYRIGDTVRFATTGPALTKKLVGIVRTEDPRVTAGLDREIRSALGDSPLLEVQSREQITREESGAIDVMLDMMYGLLGMAVVIAILGVINTLAMSVYERTREIGMLRAIGLDRTGIRRMVRLESVVISLFGAVLGIGTGVFLAWTGGSLTASGLPDYTTTVHWPRLALFLALAELIGILASLWPGGRPA